MNNDQLIAQKMEELATLIRAGRTTPVKVDFSIVVKEKAKRRERFYDALVSIKNEKLGEAHRLLTEAGWQRGVHNAKTNYSRYGNKSKPGQLLTVTGDKFFITDDKGIVQAETPVSFMGTYLKKK